MNLKNFRDQKKLFQQLDRIPSLAQDNDEEIRDTTLFISLFYTVARGQWTKALNIICYF